MSGIRNLIISILSFLEYVFLVNLWDNLLGVEREDNQLNTEDKEKEVFTKIERFVPQNFEQYIGQSKAKDILISYLQATKTRNETFPHVLIHGSSGCGKTTIAKIIANELKINFIEVITSEIKTFIDIKYRIKEAKGGIVFLDEIHSLNRDICETIYTMMEYFTYEGEAIRPFTLIGATTELGEVLKDRKPFVTRFELVLELEDYTISDIIKIVKQYREEMFNNDYIKDENLELIAKNCRGIPRIANQLLKSTIFLGSINRVLCNLGIIKDGYTIKDLKVLEYLKNGDKIGLDAISTYLNTSTENYRFIIEPYLIRSNLITRTPRGRKITPNGSKFLEELNEYIRR